MYRLFASYHPLPNRAKHWRLEQDHTRMDITVPKGFYWNGVSSPKIFYPLFPVWDVYASAALIHDWIYAQRGNIETGQVTRREADDIFYNIMVEDGVSKLRAKAMWAFVRLTGWTVWNRPKPK